MNKIRLKRRKLNKAILEYKQRIVCGSAPNVVAQNKQALVYLFIIFLLFLTYYVYYHLSNSGNNRAKWQYCFT